MFDSGLKKAKISAVYPGGHSVDLVFYEDGARASNVKVLNGSVCSSRSGSSGLHAPDNAPGGKWDLNNSKTTDIQAIVGFVRGVPFVIGFLYPPDSQTLFESPDFSVHRHPSDVYWTIDAAGNTELYHPSGLYFKIGATSAHADLTGQDFNQSWKITKNTATPVQFSVHQAGGTASITVAANGAITINSAVSIDFTAPAINLHGPVAASATVTATGDVVGNTKSLHDHTHHEHDGPATSAPI